jgi:predicted dehydrogenase
VNVSSESTVRLASVGLGWWGKVLADGARSAGAEIVGGYARSEPARDEFATSYGGRPFATYEKMLAAEDVDGILIATPHLTHADLIRAAAGAGKHVFVEKPLALTVDSAKAAVAAAETAGVVLQVGHDRRRQPANRRIRQLIEEGELGTVTMVETQQSTPNALRFVPDYWRANHDESPLGGMTSMGVHMVDTMTYLLGPIERVSTFSKEILDHPSIDHATTIIFEFASGPLGYLGTSFVVPKTTTITVRGTKGSVTNTENGERFYWQGVDDDAPQEQAMATLDTVADELGEFVRSIRGEATPETGGAEGAEVVAVLEAAVASNRSGHPVAVDDFR